MENASKALIMAGAVLIAIIIVSMFLSMYNRVSGLAKTQEDKKETEQLNAFNAEYESYNKTIMYGVDVVTLSNKINNNNANNSSYQIVLYFENKEVSQINMSGSDATIIYSGGGSEPIVNFEKSLYQCQKITYGNKGRVDAVYIVKR